MKIIADRCIDLIHFFIAIFLIMYYAASILTNALSFSKKEREVCGN